MEEILMAEFEILSWDLPERTKESHKSVSQKWMSLE
jgi:hypothetical protein